MSDLNSVEMLGFNLKLLGKKTKKNVLVSAGKMSDKEKMFPALQKLSKLNVDLFATPGTYRFLKQKGIENQEIFSNPASLNGSESGGGFLPRPGSSPLPDLPSLKPT